jgi:hypothetical protein
VVARNRPTVNDIRPRLPSKSPLGSLNPLTAGFLGITGSLSGRRVATDEQIDIVIQTPEGLIGSRPLQLQWRKISETAVVAEGPSQ